MNRISAYILALTLVLSVIFQERTRYANRIGLHQRVINTEPERRSGLYYQSANLRLCNHDQRIQSIVRSSSKDPVANDQQLKVNEKCALKENCDKEIEDQKDQATESEPDKTFLLSCSHIWQSYFSPEEDWSFSPDESNHNFESLVEHHNQDKSTSACDYPNCEQNNEALLIVDKLQNIDDFVHRNCRQK